MVLTDPGGNPMEPILGHSSVAVTEAHYAHLLKEDLRPRASR
jgi:integrase